MSREAPSTAPDTGSPPKTPAGDGDAQLLRRLSAVQLSLLDDYPFFGTLMLMAPVVLASSVPTAATDGRNLLFNPAFIAPLTVAQLRGLVVHEVLHCALLHLPRRGTRDPLLWNIAADVHVNGLIRQEKGLALPAGAVEDSLLANFSVEEIYDLLLKRAPARIPRIQLLDLQGACNPSGPTGKSGPGGDGLPEEAGRVALEAYWHNALTRALAANMMAGRGTLSAGLLREVRETTAPRLDWRAALWRHMVRTPDDFGGFDRRHVWQGLYVDTLEGESVDVDVCIDTSGSIDATQLDSFLGEVRGIVRAYPSVRCRLWYADAECFGPFDVQAHAAFPAPRGGGGTNFVPFFEAIRDAERGRADAVPSGGQRVAVYLTDGHGSFPEAVPECTVLWVVTTGGRASHEFPFGHVTRMAS